MSIIQVRPLSHAAPLLSVAVFAVSLLVPEAAFAQDRSLWYVGNGSRCNLATSRLDANLRAAGAVGIDRRSSLGDLSSYKLIFIACPTTSFSAAQAAALDAHVRAGRNLVIVGEWCGYWTSSGPSSANGLLSRLDVNSRFRCTAGSRSANRVVVDSFTEGAASIEVGYSTDMTVTSPGVALYRDGSRNVVSKERENIVLVGDYNLFNYSGRSNDRFHRNLWTGGCESFTWYLDADGDGFGGPTSTVACDSPGESWILTDGDCDDTDDAVYPGATEIPYDGIDQDCSGADLCDVDEDGFDASIGECFGLDCNDEDTNISPLADEIWYDGVDQNCDGWSDYDADFDGFDSASEPRADGSFGDDCDDKDAAIHPEADEIWYDGVDQDCDGGSDFDQDRDGFDTAWVRQPDGSVGDDCVDTDPDVYPGATSLPDGKDNNCDGITDETDSDGDGIPDQIEDLLGTDPFNPDTDGDSLWDGLEVGGDWEAPIDSDGDGMIDALDPDDDGDGIPTRIEVGPTSTPRDTDEDGTPDYLDLDSDGDSHLDAVEGQVDTDHDSVPDYLDLDSDSDGVPDADETGDSDGDGIDDRIDVDDDGDGWSTFEELRWDPRDFPDSPDYWESVADWDPVDLDSDGTANYLDPDTDGDGILDADEGHGDVDCDGLPNVLDPDHTDGPCASENLGMGTFQGGGCSGASTTGAPAGLLLGLLALVGLRRRR